jgi:hypothetical protein
MFFCGYQFPIDMIFKDHYNYQKDPWDPNLVPRNTTENDLFLFGMHGPCLYNNIQTLLQDQFAGKILFVNGEPMGNVFDEIPVEWISDPDSHPHVYRMFQMGTCPPPRRRFDKDDVALRAKYEDMYNRQTLTLYHMTTYFAGRIQTTIQNATVSKDPGILWDWLVVPSHRPRSTQRFHAVAYLASNCLPFREMAATRIADSVAPVHFGGTCHVRARNATPMPSDITTRREHFTWNHRIFHHYRYCLVMESFKIDGYITEKILNAFWGGCLPIYYGTKEVYNIFHPDSFVYYDIDNPQPALDLLQRLQTNTSLYESMISAPILKDGQETFNKYFSLLPFMGDGSINRKILGMMGMSLSK